MALLLGKYQVKQFILENPFRVLQLPTNATTQQIRKHQQRLRIEMLDEAWKGPQKVWMPLQTPPTEEQVSKAFAALEDPIERFIAELFWFWPDAQGASQFGIQAWKQSLPEQDGAAGIHNLALFHQISALECEDKLLAGDPAQAVHADEFWRGSWAGWEHLTAGSDVAHIFWDRLKARVREIDDPRLTVHLVLELKRSLKSAIETLCIDQLQSYFASRSSAHFSRMLSVVDEGLRDEEFSQEHALLEILHTEEDRANSLVTQHQDKVIPINHESKHEIEKFILSARIVDGMCRELCSLKYTNSDFDELLSSRASDILSIYVKPLRSWFVDYFNTTEDSESCKKWLDTISKFDIRGPLKLKLDDDIETINRIFNRHQEEEALEAEILEFNNKGLAVDVIVKSNEPGYSFPTACSCCMGTADQKFTISKQNKYGNITRTMSFNFPICNNCEKHQSKFTTTLSINICTFLATASLFAFIFGYNDLEIQNSVLISFLITIVLFLTSYAIKFPKFLHQTDPLEPNHGHRGKPVEFVDFSWDGSTYQLTFYNIIYAKRFAELNGGTLVNKRKKLKYPSKSIIYSGKSLRNIALINILVGPVLFFIASTMGSEQKTTKNRNSYNTTKPYTPPQESPSKPVTPSTTYTNPTQYNTTFNRRDPYLKSQIEGMKLRLGILETEIKDYRETLNSLSDQISSSKREVEFMESQLRIGYGNEFSYKSEIQNHNLLVERYNSTRNIHNTKINEYNTLLRETNEAINRYNNGY